MKKFYIIILLFLSNNLKGQSIGERFELEKCSECQIIMPIKRTMYSKKGDIEKAKHLDGKEIIVVTLKKDNIIKSYHRGYVVINQKGVFFEPLSSVINMVKKSSVYLIFSSKKTYVFDAKCYDSKNNIGSNDNEENVYCKSKDSLAIQYFNTGNLALKLNEPEKAISWFENSVKRDTTFCDAWNNLGIAHSLTGNFEKSYYSYINSVMIDSTNFISWKNLNTIFEKTKDTLNIIKTLNKMREIRPEDELTNSKLTEYKSAINSLEK